jgi:hypothetical protein
MAAHPSSSLDIVRFTVLCRARKYRGEVRAGGPPGAPILLRVYLPTAEASEKGAPAQISKGSHEPENSKPFGNGSNLRLTFSAITEQPCSDSMFRWDRFRQNESKMSITSICSTLQSELERLVCPVAVLSSLTSVINVNLDTPGVWLSGDSSPLGTLGPGFEPGSFHQAVACYMPSLE